MLMRRLARTLAAKYAAALFDLTRLLFACFEFFRLCLPAMGEMRSSPRSAG